MKAIIVKEFGGRDQLELVDRSSPEAAPGQAVIAVEVAGVGLVDVMAREGNYPMITIPGFIPGAEVAGRVTRVGPGVDAGLVGRRVLALRRPPTGGYAEEMAIGADQVFPIPDGISCEVAVALGVNALVAKFALGRARIQPDESVLIRGASGGIGLMATQLAALATKNVTVITSSKERGERLIGLGASRALDRHAGEEAGAGEYDVIVDTVAGPQIPAFLGKLAPNGRYVLCGGAAGLPAPDFGMGLLSVFHKSPTLSAFSLNSVSGPDQHRETAELISLVEAGRLAPVIDSSLPLEQAKAAHEKMETGAVFGKIILKP